MKPYKVEIYLYAENEEEAREATQTAYNFVKSSYEKGIIITARKFSDTIRKWGNNKLVQNFLR